MPLQVNEKIFVGKREHLTPENVQKLKIDQILVSSDQLLQTIVNNNIDRDRISLIAKFENFDELLNEFDKEKRSLIVCETCKTESLIFAAKLLAKFYGQTPAKSLEIIKTTKSQIILGSHHLSLLEI